MKSQTRINKKRAFLAAYVILGDLTASAAAVHMDRGEHYRWLKTDPAYVQAFAEADEQATQTLYDAAVQRALVGVYEPNVYQGRFCYPQEEFESAPAVLFRSGKRKGQIRIPAVMGVRDVPGAPPLGTWKRSEMLHQALLRAKIPAFRAAAVELTGAAGGPVAASLTIEFVRPGDVKL